MQDAKEILAGKDNLTNTSIKEQVLSQGQSKKARKRALSSAVVPEGTCREIRALREGEGVQKLLPDIEIDTSLGYKHVKAKLGVQKVRSWRWIPFVNRARTDNATLHHWVRAGEEDKQYPFAKYSNRVSVPDFSEEEYRIYLEEPEWSLEETRYLWELCDRFDLRFIIMKVTWLQE